MEKGFLWSEDEARSFGPVYICNAATGRMRSSNDGHVSQKATCGGGGGDGDGGLFADKCRPTCPAPDKRASITQNIAHRPLKARLL